jgi:hypothetical protein
MNNYPIEDILGPSNFITCTNLRTAYVAWTNSDRTEGRGRRFPLVVCECRPTADRLSKGKYVQGTDCDVTEEDIFIHNGKTYGPIDLISPSEEDIMAQREIDARKRLKEKQEKILAKALALGLSKEDIEILNQK